MKLRFLSKTTHGIVDYLAAVALLAGPFVLNLGSSSRMAIWLSVATGVAVILVSILTKYKYGLVQLIPFDLHLAIDLAAATAFVVAPYLFGFSGLDAAYYEINAAIVYLVVAFTNNNPGLAN